MKLCGLKLVLALAVSPIFSITTLAGVDQCKPIGWATRSGRTSTEFEVTGGGNATPITVTTFNDLQKYAKDDSPRVIYIDGTLGDGWSGTSGSRLNITASNKTIIGLRPGTLLKAPIHITSKASNIIIRNIVIKGPGSNADQAWDNLTIEGESKNIWVDHCEFWDGQDGNADVVKGSDNVTFTWCIFGYEKKSTHNLSNLIGSSDNEPVSEGKLNVTYMFNWWKAANQRKPRCRYGNVHVVNNLLTGDASITNGTDVLGISAGYMCTVRTERNVFINENNPIYTGNANGTGVNETIDNIFTNCSGNTKGTGTSFTPPYEYTSFMLNASEVEAAVRANAGATLNSPTECDENYVEPPPSTPDRQYQADKGTLTEAVVESSNAGFHGDAYVNFNKGGDLVVPVTVDVAGEYKFEIDFTNGSSEDRSLVISAGAGDTTVVFEKTGAWTVWATKEISLKLSAGENSVKFATLEGMDGPNLDQFDVTLVKKDESSESLPLSGKVTPLQNAYRVNVFDINGKLVRKMNHVPQTALKDVQNLSKGLYPGVYLVKAAASGDSRQFFIVAK
jgi:pectate lyase